MHSKAHLIHAEIKQQIPLSDNDNELSILAKTIDTAYSQEQINYSEACHMALLLVQRSRAIYHAEVIESETLTLA